MPDPISVLLEAAAIAGRTDPSPTDELATFGHLPLPPTLRCQDCGRRLELQLLGEQRWWSHAIDERFGRAFDDTYRR